MKLKHNRAYSAQRAMAYPPTGDQLDAILELGRVLRDKKIIDPFPQKVDDWIRNCDNVKKKFVKDV